VEFLLLGSVQIWSAGQQVELKRRQERLLLAVLLLEPGKAVPAERLIELLWPDKLPGHPKRALQVYASRLRGVLAAGESQLTIGPHGYAIAVPPGRTDIERFMSLVEQAKPLEDLEQRRKLLVDALALWRGHALADVASEDVRRRLCGGLDESRWAAQELRLTTELALGRHQELLPELAELTALQPTRETLAATRMLALYRSGRQTDALAVYADLARHLDEELGVEPGAEVRELQVAILRQDDSLDHTEFSAGPRELPADIGVLVGRDAVLEELSAELTRGGRPDGVPAVVCLYGAAGTGKSAAAIRLGHTLAAQYPGGQLFARLQDVNGDALPPRVVAGRLLRSLGVDGQTMPDSLEERASLLRSRLAGKSVLLVFDDVVDAAQLRPLLPADGRCGVVVTARRPILGLEDATHREILPLTEETSAELLGKLSGVVADDLTEVVRHCVGLPLALRIVGARLALAGEDVLDVAKALADDVQRLDYLVAGDRAVRASLEVTLRVATPAADHLFARLALIGADEFPAWTAAPLLGISEDESRIALDSLVALGLVQLSRLEPATYSLHNLVRAYAAERLAQLAAEERREAEQNYLGTVLRLLTIADGQVNHGIIVYVPLDEVDSMELPAAEAEAAGGAAWLDDATSVVHAAVRLAVRDWPEIAGQLAIRFNGYLAVRDNREVRKEVLELARNAVVAAGETALEAELDRAVFGALAQSHVGNAELVAVADRSLRSAQRAGVTELLIAALAQVAWIEASLGHFERTFEVGEEILRIVDANPEAEGSRARGLDHIASALHSLGRMGEAAVPRRQAVELSPPGSRLRAIRLVLLARVLLEDPARLAEATEVVQEARETVDELGDELGGAHVDAIEAHLQAELGRPERARELLSRAATVFELRPDPSGQLVYATAQARLELASGRADRARQVFGAALEEAVRTDDIEGATEIRRQLTRIDHGM